MLKKVRIFAFPSSQQFGKTEILICCGETLDIPNIIARRAHLNQYSAETDVFIDFNKYKYKVASNQFAVSVYRIHNDS